MSDDEPPKYQPALPATPGQGDQNLGEWATEEATEISARGRRRRRAEQKQIGRYQYLDRSDDCAGSVGSGRDCQRWLVYSEYGSQRLRGEDRGGRNGEVLPIASDPGVGQPSGLVVAVRAAP